jgi:hypothetical protein
VPPDAPSIIVGHFHVAGGKLVRRSPFRGPWPSVNHEAARDEPQRNGKSLQLLF